MAFGQIFPDKLNMQSDNDLVQFDSRGRWYYRYQIVNDTVRRIKARTNNFEHFLDSLKKIGYIDQQPISLTKESKFALKILNHSFLRVDTIYSKVDSIYVTKIGASLIASKYKIDKKWVFENEYSTMKLLEVENKIKYCDNHSLVYYSKCKTFNVQFDLTIFTWLIGSYETFQTGDHYEDLYFK